MPSAALRSPAQSRAEARPAVPARRPAGREAHWGRHLAALSMVLIAPFVGAVSILHPALAIMGGLAVALVALVAVRPQVGGYLVIAATPLIVGIDRGQIVPFLRPSEALALAVGCGLALRGALQWQTGATRHPHLTRLELALVIMATCNSVVPLIWMLVRQHPIGPDDLLYALVLWKLIGVYVLVRVSIKTDRQAMLCLWLSVIAASVVAIVALLQSLGLFGVPHFLATYYAPFGYTNLAQNSRGSSTVALPAATADLMIYNLAVVSGLWIFSRRSRPALAVVAMLFIFGALSAGEFSSAIGLIIGVCCIAIVTSYPRLLAFFVPAAAGAIYALRPVIERRLSGFDSVSGLPVSWTGRLTNLRTYFWPRLFSDGNFVLGVQPSARVPVSSQGTGYVWIESGYTWLLWGGGIPLLIGFLLLLRAAIGLGWDTGRHRDDATRIAGIAIFVSVIVMSVLMIFDPHLTYRGAAEEMFALFALASLPARTIHASPESRTTRLEARP
ncbi:MAG: hypothetical protein JWO57_3333 [Pseudonocardiales bacterium]|nr:hypothetical protein [Pseudonocardiales bacterium]